MKKIIKIILAVVILNILITTIVKGSILLSISPILKKYDINVMEIISNDISEEEYQMIKKEVEVSSRNMGRKVARKMIKAISPEYEFVDQDKKSTRVPTVEEALNLMEKSAKRGIDRGLKELEDFNENELKDIKEKALEIAKQN